MIKVAYCFGGCKAPNQPDPPIWPKELQRVDQGTGDLGQRMKRLARFRTTPALIIGSDIPQIEKRHMPRRLNVVQNQFVFRPSTDGGFWLVGAPGVGRFQTQYSQIVDGRLNTL